MSLKSALGVSMISVMSFSIVNSLCKKNELRLKSMNAVINLQKEHSLYNWLEQNLAVERAEES